jgi:hypothetical protein
MVQCVCFRYFVPCDAFYPLGRRCVCKSTLCSVAKFACILRRFTTGGHRARLDLVVYKLVKEVIPFLLSRLAITRQLAADREARKDLYSGRPIQLPLTCGMPLAFFQVKSGFPRGLQYAFLRNM